MTKLSDIAELANQVLHNQTKYFTDKKIIEEIFDFTSRTYSPQAIISRLTIIDSYYSTQMNKRYYGIEDIANKIWEISPENENEVKRCFLDFAKNLQNEEIQRLFLHKNYGIHKNGTDAGMAISLISKYAYYQTGFEFPIYDRLAKIVYPLIMKKYFPDKTIELSIYSTDIILFIKSINQLNKLSEIYHYDRLDNLLWLSGKILDGNFSLVFKEKETYRLFAKDVEKNASKTIKLINGEIKYLKFSERMLGYIKEKKLILNEIIKDEKLKEFIEFALSLNE